MQLLFFLPFLMVSWALFIFAYESYMDKYFLDLAGYLFAAVALLLYGLRHIKKKERSPQSMIMLNIGLLPLLYANLIVLPLMLQGKPINETGMVYVLVLIYGPIFYIGAMIFFEIINIFFGE